jgi:hypothetical protein
MRRPAAALRTLALAVLLAAAALVRPAAALPPRPEFTTSLGHSFGVLGAEAKKGGTALEVAALWPVREGWSAGVALWGGDTSSGTERVEDPVTFQDLGPVPGTSEYFAGAGWAMELRPGVFGRDSTGAAGPLRGLVLAGNAGVYRVGVAFGGEETHQQSFGFGLGIGWRFALGEHHQVGPALRYARVFDDQLGRFFSAGLDWTWR